MRWIAVLAVGVAGGLFGVPGAHAADREDFTTPSGNISCSIFSHAPPGGVAVPAVRCDLLERTFTPPPEPPRPSPTCGMGPWAKSVKLSRGAPPRFLCISDTVATADAPVLDYGARTSAYGFDCVSREDGVSCTDTGTGHGFRLARESYAFF